MKLTRNQNKQLQIKKTKNPKITQLPNITKFLNQHLNKSQLRKFHKRNNIKGRLIL